MSELENQLVAGLEGALGALHDLSVLSPAIDPIEQLKIARTAARSIAERLTRGDDEDLATCVNALATLGIVEDHDPLWWRSPLGQHVARSIGHPTAAKVTVSMAAAMLGTTTGAVEQAIDAGQLTLTEEGVPTVQIVALKSRPLEP